MFLEHAFSATWTGAGAALGHTRPDIALRDLLASIRGVGVRLAAGLIIGASGARLIRRGGLRWTWALCVTLLALMLRSALGSATLTLVTAGFGAALRGRRWHREDIDAGADLAVSATRRRGPLDAWRTTTAAARGRWGAPRAGARPAAAQLDLGRDGHGRTMSIPFGAGGRGVHSLVVGATGSGKTVTQTVVAVRAIESGMGAIVIDPKGDDALRGEVHRASLAAGRRFLEWTPNGPSMYNPYARGGETEVADKLLAGESFTEPHYQRQAQRYMGHVVRSLRGAGEEVSLQSVVDRLNPHRLEALARRLPEPEALMTHDYLDSLTARQERDLAGVRDRLAIIAESDVGVWLDPRYAEGDRLNLLDAARSRAVVYFDLRADSRPLLTRMLGAAIIQDLQTTIASLQSEPVPTFVVIDEFSALAAEEVVRLFGRARSAGVSLMLATQELSDLRLPGREALLERVMGNLSVLIAHRQVVPESAALIASLAGTKGVWRTSRRSDGTVTRTRAREGVLHPADVVTLATGWAAVIVPGEGCRSAITRVDRSRLSTGP
jgi:type IV secretory pathway TraG/TraD family ATPase VirD4